LAWTGQQRSLTGSFCWAFVDLGAGKLFRRGQASTIVLDVEARFRNTLA